MPPLFISSTKTSINVKCILPNDNGAKIINITFEIADENDSIYIYSIIIETFMWKKAEIVSTKRDFLHYTIISILYFILYYYRVKS